MQALAHEKEEHRGAGNGSRRNSALSRRVRISLARHRKRSSGCTPASIASSARN